MSRTLPTFRLEKDGEIVTVDERSIDQFLADGWTQVDQSEPVVLQTTEADLDEAPQGGQGEDPADMTSEVPGEAPQDAEGKTLEEAFALLTEVDMKTDGSPKINAMRALTGRADLGHEEVTEAWDAFISV